MTKDFLEGMIKGKIAETIVREMFIKAGFVVFPFGYEDSLSTLTSWSLRLLGKRTYTNTDEEFLEYARDLNAIEPREKIRNLPDFIIMRIKHPLTRERIENLSEEQKNLKVLHFVEVKYRADGIIRYDNEWTKIVQGTNLILVTPNKPYFHTTLLLTLELRKKWYDIWVDCLPEALELTPLKESVEFMEFDNFNFKPYIEMVERYLKPKAEKS
jgi:hypothetical protein